MARLSPEQWELVRADYEVHQLTFVELSEKYGVHFSNISRRAKKDGWNQAKTQTLIAATVENEKEKHAIRKETQTLNAKTQYEMQSVVFDRLAFELQNNADLQRIRDKIMQLVDHTDRMSDLSQATTALLGIRHTQVPKQPEVAVQVNNLPERIERVVIDGKHSD